MDPVSCQCMDEAAPLLRHTSGRPSDPHSDASYHTCRTHIIDFDPNDDDPDNPMNWPSSFKWTIVALLAAMAFTVTFTCISVVPVATRITDDLGGGEGSKSASVLLVTIWELGEAAGPLLIAPLSEMYGRYPLMNCCNTLFVVCTALAAVSQSTTLFIAARALTGLAVASNVLNPAIVGDMFAPEKRGAAMSTVMFAPLIGGAVGPAIAGAVAQTAGWRQVLWISVALAGGCELLFLFCFRETYKVPILRRRAAELRADTGNLKLRTEFDDQERSWRMLWESVLRPVHVLFASSVLMALSLFGSVVFSYYYVMAVTLPDILESRYGLSPALTGSAFMSFSIGSFISVSICNLTLDRIYVRLRDSRKGPGQPEYRLPLAILGGFTLPLSVILYGWIAQLRLPLPLLLSSVALLGFTLLFAFLPLLAYVVDAFGLFSASALTGIIVTRCLMGTFLPLTTGPLIDSFGYGWGFTLFGALSFCLAPIPVFAFKYGARWRQLSTYTNTQDA